MKITISNNTVDGVKGGIFNLNGKDVYEMQTRIEKLERELAEARQYGAYLAEIMAAKHYPENKAWEVLPDLVGVLTQIDNMIAGISDQLAAEKALSDRLIVAGANALQNYTMFIKKFSDDWDDACAAYRKARGM